MRLSRRACLLAIAISVVFVVSSPALGAATIVILNNDAAGVGFNDATAVAAVGGNPGTTLGQQRLNAFQAAANVWGATLTSSVTISIRAQWTALNCTATTAVLGSAGSVSSFREFPGAPFTGTWYGGSLANKLSGSDLDPAAAEINANFNVNLGNTGCLDGVHFYLGLDNNHGNDVDLFAVLLHEFSHGFGFSPGPTSSSTGVEAQGFPSIYERFLLDDTTGKSWFQMTDAERVASAVNTNKLVWNGFQVTTSVPSVLGGTPLLKVMSPAAIAGNYSIGTAAFGPALSSPGVTGTVVQALDAADGAGPTTTDGCSAFSNAGAVSGHIALIDRGTCTFIIKVKNAQNAGASAVVIVDNQVASSPPGLGGTDPTITIPSASITQASGDSIKAQLGSGVNATLGIDASVRAGADQFNHSLLFAPNPVQSGSSVSHWDTSAFPNQLMEPNISNDLTHIVTAPTDLTFALLRDLGWVADAATNVQFSAANYNVGEGGVSATVTVTRSGDTTGASTVDFLTSDGIALQSQDYVVNSGTLSFASGDTSKTFNVLIVDDAFVDTPETLNVTLSNPVGALLGAPGTATVTIMDNDTAGATSPAPKRFAAVLDGAQETPANGSPAKGTGLVLLDGSETSAKVGLQFQNLGSAETAAHIHGNGAAGVMAPILFTLAPPLVNPIVNLQISPTAQQVADLKAGLHYQNVHSVNFPNGEIRGQLRWNPTLEENFFVRQQYLDFLSRDGDPGGFNFWTGTISGCFADAQCFHDRTLSTADAFFFEPEFQQTAGFVFRAYRAAYGNTQPFPVNDNTNQTEAHKLVNYSVYVNDRARVVGGANLASTQLSFANLFVTRPEFISRYPVTLTGSEFVAAILATIQNSDGVDLSFQTTALMNEYNAGGRAQVLYRLADDNAQSNPINNQAFVNAEYNRQFALTLYFGYLRRNPDIAGFLFWQSQINLAPMRDVAKQNALVCSFITAAEYQFRFGVNAPRSNGECPQ